MSCLGKLNSFLIVFIFSVLASSAGESATVEGRIVSEKIKKLEKFIVFVANVDPKLFSLSGESAIIVQKKNRFIPPVLPVVRGMNVRFMNRDKYWHNVHPAEGSDILYLSIRPGSTSEPLPLDEEGEVMLLCDFHPDMRGFILVLQNPFFSYVDSSGNFSIKNIPPGKYSVTTWHEEFVSFTHNVELGAMDDRVEVEYLY